MRLSPFSWALSSSSILNSTFSRIPSKDTLWIKLAHATQKTAPETASAPRIVGKSLFTLTIPTYKTHVLFELHVD
jgi:hypothetical protein